VMLAGKDSTAREMVEQRTSVAARDEYALEGVTRRCVPPHGDSMGSVLAGQPAHTRQRFGANLLQPDKADASDRVVVLKFWAKWWREKALHHLGVHSEVDEKSATYEAGDYWKMHGMSANA